MARPVKVKLSGIRTTSARPVAIDEAAVAAASAGPAKVRKPRKSAVTATTIGDGKAAVAKLLALVQHSLDEDKAEEVVVVDLDGKTSIADYMVVANGRSQRQVGAIADHLVDRLKQAGVKGRIRTEGMPQNDWVLVDAGDIIIHVFRPEVRGFYKLEKMWSLDLSDPDRLTADEA